MKRDFKPEVIRPKFGDKPVAIDRTSGPLPCKHTYVTVYKRLGRVVCRSCEEDVDPFDVLASLAMSWEACTYGQAEVDKLNDRVLALKAEERRLKGRLRRATDKAEDNFDTLYEALLSKFESASTFEDVQAAEQWFSDYSWLKTEQRKKLREANRKAFERAGSNMRKKSRPLQVVKGENDG